MSDHPAMTPETSPHMPRAEAGEAERIELPNGWWFCLSRYAWSKQARYDLISADGSRIGPPWSKPDALTHAAYIDTLRRERDEAGQSIAAKASRKGEQILAWCDHEADAYSDGSSLTLYAAHAEGMGHAPTGFHIIEWGGAFEDGPDDGGAHLPDWWFVAGSEFEVAANPIKWWPLPVFAQIAATAPTIPGSEPDAGATSGGERP